MPIEESAIKLAQRFIAGATKPAEVNPQLPQRPNSPPRPVQGIFLFAPRGHIVQRPTASEDRRYVYDAARNLNCRTNNTTLNTFKVDTKNQLTNATPVGNQTYDGNGTVRSSRPRWSPRHCAKPKPLSILNITGLQPFLQHLPVHTVCVSS